MKLATSGKVGITLAVVLLISLLAGADARRYRHTVRHWHRRGHKHGYYRWHGPGSYGPRHPGPRDFPEDSSDDPEPTSPPDREPIELPYEEYLQSSVRKVWSKLKLPYLYVVMFDHRIWNYESPSGTVSTISMANGKKLTLRQTYRSDEDCHFHGTCKFIVEVDSYDEGVFPKNTAGKGCKYTFIAESNERGTTKLSAGFELPEPNDVLDRYHVALFLDMMDSAAKYFKPARCDMKTERLTGVCGNPFNPLTGATNQEMRRMAEPRYKDGCSEPITKGVPNPRTLSNKLSEAPSTRSDKRRRLNDLFVVFGQFIVHDFGLTPAGKGPFKDTSMSIRVTDPKDPVFYEGTIAFSRSVYELKDTGHGMEGKCPRQHHNVQSAFIDGSLVYGPNNKYRYLRKFEDGLLKINEDFKATGEHLPNNTVSAVGLKVPMDPDPTSDLFLAAGDNRANENAILLSMHTLFMREHNRLAREVKRHCGSCDDEEIFQLARRILGMELQKITYDEWLPLMLGYKLKYRGFKPYANGNLFHELSTAVTRFGHPMQIDRHVLLGPGNKPFGPKPSMNLRDSFFSPSPVLEYGIEPFLRGSANTEADPFDHIVNEDLRNFLFKRIPTTIGFDLFAANIQRGRDHGLPSFNQVRKVCGLRPLSFLEMANDSEEVATVLEKLYSTPDDVDLFIGGAIEKREYGAELGETFICIAHRQFSELASADWFFYKNHRSIPSKLWRMPTATRILYGKFTLRDVILLNTDIHPDDIQEDSLVMPFESY